MQPTQPDNPVSRKHPRLLASFNWDKTISQAIFPEPYAKEPAPCIIFPKELKHTYKDDYTDERRANVALLELRPSADMTIAISSGTAGGTVLPERFVAKIVHRCNANSGDTINSVRHSYCIMRA